MLIEIANKKSWNDYLAKMDDFPAKSYYRFWYAQACEISDSAKACAVYFEGPDSGKVFYPFLLKKVPEIISKNDFYSVESFYGYGGPHFQNCSEKDIAVFFSEIEKWFEKQNVVAEFVRFNPFTRNHLLAKDNYALEHNRTTVYVQLNTEDENFDPISSFSPARLRNYKKSLNSELVIKVSRSIHNFQEIYEKTMCRLSASEYLRFSSEYFAHLANIVQNSDEILIFEVHRHNQCIAASMIFNEKNALHYHLGGMDKDFKEFYPSVYLFSEVIKFGNSRNRKILHLGGGLSMDQNDGLFRFKKGFSRTTLDFYIGKKIHNHPVYKELSEKWSALSNKKSSRFLHFHDTIK